MSENVELLRQIQDGCVSASVPVSELLRRCQVFAARAKIPELGDWVRYELNGYPLEAALPDYRVFDGQAKGHFLGPFGSGLRNALLPSANLPEEYRDWARKAYIRQPIAALEQVIAAKEDSGITVPWSGDLVAHVQDKFYENMALCQAWLELSRSQFVTAVESVRNRILSFAIDAEQHVGSNTRAPATQALAHVFHTHIYGSVGSLAQGSSDFTQRVGIGAGDLTALIRELRAMSVEENDIAELQQAVKDDGQLEGKKLGPKVAAWLGRMIGKAASGVWAVATSTATSVLPKLLERYYGVAE